MGVGWEGEGLGGNRERGGLSGSGAGCPQRSKECAQCDNGRSTEPLEHYRSTARYHTSTSYSGYYASEARYGGSTRVALCGVRRQHHGCRRSSVRTPSSAVTCPFSCSTVPAATDATTLQRTQQRCNGRNNAATDAALQRTQRCNGGNSAATTRGRNTACNDATRQGCARVCVCRRLCA